MDSHTKVSTLNLLEEFFADQSQESVSVSRIVEVLSERAFGVVLLFLAVPNAMLLSSIPGISAIFGIPIIIISVQMLMGSSNLWIPENIKKRRLSNSDCQKFLQLSKPYISKLERLAKPRLLLIGKILEKVAAFICLLLGILIALPIPLGNFFGGICLLVISLGLVEKDGVMIFIGCVLSIITASLFVVVIKSLLASIWHWLL